MVFLGLHVLVVAVCMGLILLRRYRQPEARLAWLVVVLVMPYVGALLYLLLGQTSVGRARITHLERAFKELPRVEATPGWPGAGAAAEEAKRYAPVFRVGESISGYPPVGNNQGRLMADSDTAIESIVTDIDAATDHVHVLFYIWLTDRNGTKVAEALKRAARRGVTCRAMVDDLGSRHFIRSAQWQALADSGVHTARALTIGNPLRRIFNGRIDLRNHRKLVVIDNRISYCGSQNCADPEFLPKAKYGPWVDAVMRFEGPIVRQNQHLFISDWMGNGGDELSELLHQPLPTVKAGFTAQVIATGPTVRNAAMPEMFETLIYTARRELFITTPYYVPNAALQAALCASANRGVDTSIIFPARNDDFAVGATSRSYYEDLLNAGVKIYEFKPGLLHTKSLTVDGEITLIGSANMDRRSFYLNYENNIVLHDPDLTAQMRARQGFYLTQSRAISLAEVKQWSASKRLWHNALAITGPIL